MEAGIDGSVISLNFKIKNRLDPSQINDEKEEVEEKFIDTKTESLKRKKLIPDRIKGALLVIIGSFLFCINAAFTKKAFILSVGDNTFIRFFLQGITFTIFCKCKGFKMFSEKEYRKWLFLSGTLSVFIIITCFLAISLVHISDFVTIGNSSIIITAILCRIFLKEKLTIIHIIAFVFTMTGVVFICRPTFLFSNSQYKTVANQSYNSSFKNETLNEDESALELKRLIGVGVVLLSAVGIGLVTLVFKKLANAKIHYAVINIFSGK